MKIKHILIIPTLAFLLISGCSIVPQERRQQEVIKESAALASTHNSGLEQHIAAAPAPTISTTVNPKTGEMTNTITPPPATISSHYSETGNVDATSSDALFFKSIESIPWGVTVILACIGITFLLAIWWYLRRSSAAVAASAQLADQFAAKQIQRIRERAALSTDHKEIATHNLEIAHLEAERGKMAAARKK